MAFSPVGPAGVRSFGLRAGRRSLLMALLFGAVAWSLAVHPAAAGISWCRSDPVVLFTVQNGGLLGSTALADVFVSAPLEILTSVTGPNEIVITTPTSVTALLAINDLGFGRGEAVTFKQSSNLKHNRKGIQIRISVYVPATRDLAVEVNFAPRVVGLLWPTTASGRTNQWIVLRATF